MIRIFCCRSKTAGSLLVAWLMTGSALAMICLTAQVADAQPAKQEAAERLNRLVRTARAKGDYKEAIARGHELVDLLPDSNVHPYNLSCAYALLGDKDNSVRWLGRAADKGFLFTATTMRDADLDGIRSHPGYAGALAMIQKNNAVRLDELKPMIDGAPLITHLPPGYDPTKPAPLIVTLHPYGGRAKPIADIWRPIAADIGASPSQLTREFRSPHGFLFEHPADWLVVSSDADLERLGRHVGERIPLDHIDWTEFAVFLFDSRNEVVDIAERAPPTAHSHDIPVSIFQEEIR